MSNCHHAEWIPTDLISLGSGATGYASWAPQVPQNSSMQLGSPLGCGLHIGADSDPWIYPRSLNQLHSKVKAPQNLRPKKLNGSKGLPLARPNPEKAASNHKIWQWRDEVMQWNTNHWCPSVVRHWSAKSTEEVHLLVEFLMVSWERLLKYHGKGWLNHDKWMTFDASVVSHPSPRRWPSHLNQVVQALAKTNSVGGTGPVTCCYRLVLGYSYEVGSSK